MFLKDVEKDTNLLDEQLRGSTTKLSYLNNPKYFWFEENQIIDLLDEEDEGDDSNDNSGNGLEVDAGHIMTNQEIVTKYWTICMNVRLVSVKLQRWMSTIVLLVCAWTAIRLAHWLSHTPTWYGVLMLIMPLVLIPLLTSSYAEVNYEGAKIVQSIFPTEGRIQYNTIIQ
jgi:hypothetical protein